MEELYRHVYAQVLSSHALTWQIAPIYLTSCVKQGISLVEILLYQQPVQLSKILLKVIELAPGVNFCYVVIFVTLESHFWFRYHLSISVCLMQSLEIWCMYELDSVASKIMKVCYILEICRKALH